MRQPVFVFEPDPQVALHAMMIHDYWGPGGPIEQGRFRWFVGTGWDRDFEALTTSDPLLGIPAMAVGLGLQSGAMQDWLRALSEKVVRRDDAYREEIARYYASIDPAEQSALFGDNPPRRPRVLLLTTRFSTVLQYSTRDAAEAFEQIGWDARTLIEPTPIHRLYKTAMRAAFAEHKPDLVFQIDHLRYEHGDLFDACVPFACWAQDHLPHLKTTQAAASIGPRDFVLTDAGPMYSSRHGYPPRQFVGLSKLTRVPPTPDPAPTPSGGDNGPPAEDLVYVSNASADPKGMVGPLLDGLGGGPGLRRLAEGCVDRLFAIYAAGGSVPTYAELCSLVRNYNAQTGAGLNEEPLRALADRLAHPLNDALYRQQAVQWLINLATERGLSLALYGAGWEKREAFAPYARAASPMGRTWKP